ncbi:hypothetical protein ACFRAQ_35855 [Nocardia sp. NPDC056611]|uniref:hypothetical protein n=1 Tax=Nocardia sp. NPDC056611 TaxID=3345877 RepID=UPI00366F6076
MANPDGKTGASRELNTYWTKGAGLAKWADNPRPWRALRTQLLQYMSIEKATGLATEYFYEVFHYYPGSAQHRKRDRG